PVGTVAFSGDGGRLGVVTGQAVVKGWDVTARQEAFVYPRAPGQVHGLTFDPDGRCLALVMVAATGVFRGLATATGRELFSLPVSGSVLGVATTPDGRCVAVSSQYRDQETKRQVGEVKVWDAGGARIFTAGEPLRFAVLALSRDGRLLAAAGRDGTVR